MRKIAYASAIVYVSPDGHGKWTPLMSDDVPDWVKDPDVMARMLAGEDCSIGGPWYLAVGDKSKIILPGSLH